MSIKENLKKIKWESAFVPIVILLSWLALFGLVMVFEPDFKALTDSGQGEIKIMELSSDYLARNKTGEFESNYQYVGSKTGKKFHLVTCSGAKRIKDSNKIWFASVEEALKLGYEPASNCPGLK